MKKTYITPTIQILDCQSTQIITSSISMGIYATEVANTEEGEQLGNSRRGTWGDLWSEN